MRFELMELRGQFVAIVVVAVGLELGQRLGLATHGVP